eukprot:750583-Hanusia_phi.AAC.3
MTYLSQKEAKKGTSQKLAFKRKWWECTGHSCDTPRIPDQHGWSMGAHEKYESYPCLHHDCLVPSKQIWNANGEAVQGKNAPNVGEKFSAYGGRGRGWPGYDANNQNAKKEMARELGGQESREVGGDGYHDPLQRQSFYGGALGQVKFLNPAGAVRVTHRGIGTQRWDTNGESLPQPEKIPPKPVTSDPHASLQGYLDSQIDQESSAAADEEDQSESQPTAAEAREGSEPVSDVKSSAQRQFYQSRKVGSKILGDSSKVLESMPEYTEKEWKAGKLVKVCDGTGCHWQRIEEGSMDTKGLPWDFNTDNNHDSGEEDAGRPDVVQYPVTDFSSQSPGVQRDGKVLKPGVVRVCDGSAGCVEQMDFHHLHEAKGEKTGQPTQLTSSGQMQLEDSAAERTVQYVKDFLRSENITKMSVESIQAALSSVGLNVSADEIRMEAVELGGDPVPLLSYGSHLGRYQGRRRVLEGCVEGEEGGDEKGEEGSGCALKQSCAQEEKWEQREGRGEQGEGTKDL